MPKLRLKLWELLVVCITIGTFGGTLFGALVGHVRTGAMIGVGACVLFGLAAELYIRLYLR
jgi:hypothetical protein